MMKYAVINLVKNIGKPSEEKELFFEGITDKEQKIIDVITKPDIAKEIGVTPENIQFYLSKLYKIAIQNGARFTKLKNKLPELVEFIRQYKKEKNIETFINESEV